MAETAVKNAVCHACGADVRNESLYCYNCGGSIRVEKTVIPDTPPDDPILPEVRPPLKSAASLRKQRRAFNRQPVEVSWERREDPSKVFVVATIVLTIAALVLIFLAFYLR